MLVKLICLFPSLYHNSFIILYICPGDVELLGPPVTESSISNSSETYRGDPFSIAVVDFQKRCDALSPIFLEMIKDVNGQIL